VASCHCPIMSNQNPSSTAHIVNKAWNYAHVLRDDGLSYMAYTEQITFLLFLKMADELTRPPYNRPPIVTFPPEPSPNRALDFGLDQEDQGHGQEASFGGRDREQVAAG
jgi:hypothetical protein